MTGLKTAALDADFNHTLTDWVTTAANCGPCPWGQSYPLTYVSRHVGPATRSAKQSGGAIMATGSCQLQVTFAWRQKEGAAFPGTIGQFSIAQRVLSNPR